MKSGRAGRGERKYIVLRKARGLKNHRFGPDEISSLKQGNIESGKERLRIGYQSVTIPVSMHRIRILSGYCIFGFEFEGQ